MNSAVVGASPLFGVPIAAVVSVAMIVVITPVLRRYALARPNARSSHVVATPQGGGVAIVGACVVVGTALVAAVTGGVSGEVITLVIATLGLAAVGARDDVRPLRVSVRLAVQAAAVLAVILATGERLVPALPAPLEIGLALLAGLWFVNLVNFTDGLDWMALSSMVPITATLTLLGCFGAYPPVPTLIAAALLGGLLGFAPFNRPVARLFMGDVGALPLGLIVAWLLHHLAAEGALAAALLLPLYPVADTSLTLLWRLARGDTVWRAHRSHYYQVATDNGFTVPQVVGAVFAVSVALAGLAVASLLWPSRIVTFATLMAGAGLVALLLRRFNRPRRAPPRKGTAL